MTVVRQSQRENLVGFQIDWRQFHIPYSLGCDIVDAFSYGLRDSCEAEDGPAACAIVWFMLVANGLPVPPRTYACRCDPWEVGSLIVNLRFEACHGQIEELEKLLLEAALAAGIYDRAVPSSVAD